MENLEKKQRPMGRCFLMDQDIKQGEQRRGIEWEKYEVFIPRLLYKDADYAHQQGGHEDVGCFFNNFEPG